MAVRFRPEHPGAGGVPEPRDNLAEILEFRRALTSHPGSVTDHARERHGAAASSEGPARQRGDQRPEAAVTPLTSASALLGRVTSNSSTSARRGCAPLGAAVLDPSRRGRSSAGAHATDDTELSSREDALEEVREVARKMLARKPLSEEELRRALLRRAFDGALVDEVVWGCVDAKLIDDAALAETVTMTLRERRSASAGEIRRKLQERGLSNSVIEAATAALDAESEHQLLRDAAEQRARKLRGLDRSTAERRLIAFLGRRGWSGEEVFRTAREALTEAGIEPRPYTL